MFSSSMINTKIVVEIMKVTCVRPIRCCLLAISMLPCVAWQLRGNTQPKAYNSEKHDVCKFAAQKIVSQGEREQSGRCGRRNHRHALHRNDCLRESGESREHLFVVRRDRQWQ